MNHGANDIVDRLRAQAKATGHVWVDVMLLLLEAANEINRLGSMYMQTGNELDDLKMTLRDAQHNAASERSQEKT